MNKIYKVIWCHIRRTHIVTSELASNKKQRGSINTLVIAAILTFGSTSFSTAAKLGAGADDSGNNATAIGINAKATGDAALAIGKDSIARGPQSTAIGRTAMATMTRATAIGDDAQALAQGALAIGNSSRATGLRSFSLGVNSNSSASYAIAIGDHANAQHERSIALGYLSVTTQKDEVSLGGGITASGLLTRKITNLKEGLISSSSKEAINGSQLYTTAKSIASALGGGASVNNDGSLKNPTYKFGQSSFNNVGDALKNIDNRVTNNTDSIAKGNLGLIRLGTNSTIIIDKDLAKGYEKFDFSGVDKNSKTINRKLTGIAKGQFDNDAVNVSQLKEVAQKGIRIQRM